MPPISTRGPPSSYTSPWARDAPYYPFTSRVSLSEDALCALDRERRAPSKVTCDTIDHDSESQASSCPSSPSSVSSSWSTDSLSESSTDISSEHESERKSEHSRTRSSERKTSVASSSISHASYSTLPEVYHTLAKYELRARSRGRKCSTASSSRVRPTDVIVEDRELPTSTRGRTHHIIERMDSSATRASSPDRSSSKHSKRSTHSRRTSIVAPSGYWRWESTSSHGATKRSRLHSESRSRSRSRCRDCSRTRPSIEGPLIRLSSRRTEVAISPFQMPYEVEVRRPREQRSSSRAASSSAERFADRFGEAIGLWEREHRKPKRSRSEEQSRKRRYSVML